MSATDDLLRELIERRESERKTAAPPPATPAPPVETKTEPRPLSRSDPHLAFAVAAFIIGGLLWPVGARFTIDGLSWIAATVLQFLRAPALIPAILDWRVYVALAIIPLICSLVEWRSPVERRAGRLRLRSHDTVAAWAVIWSLDILTTFYGLRAPAPDAWPIAREIAASIPLSGLIAVILSIFPEYMLRSGWRRLRR